MASSLLTKSVSQLGEVQILQRITVHKNDVTCCDFGANNATMVSCSSDKTIRIWKWEKGTGYAESDISPLMGHKYGVTCVKISPQSTMLASTSIDGTAVLWYLKSGVKIHTFAQVNNDAIRICRFSSNSSILATAGDSGAICVWDLVHKSLIKTIFQHEGMVQALSFTPDSVYLMSACTTGVFKVWSVDQICDSTTEDATCLLSVDNAHDLGVLSCDFSNVIVSDVDNPLRKIYTLVSSGNDNCVKTWNLITHILPKETDRFGDVDLQQLKTLEGHDSAVTSVAYNYSGSFIASASLDKTIRLWKAQTDECITVLTGHSRYVNCSVFSRETILLASGSNDKSIIVWDLTGCLTLDSEIANPQLLLNHWGNLHESQIALLTESPENTVQLTQKIEDSHSGSINSCHFNVKKNLATGSSDKQIRMFEYSEDNGLFNEMTFSPLEGHTYSINQVEFSRDGQYLASCSLDGCTIVWNTQDGQQAKPDIPENSLGIRTCRISPNNKILVTAGDDEKATVYDFQEMEQCAIFEGHFEAISSVAFTPDSKILVTVCNNGDLRLWSLENFDNLEPIHTELEAHDLGVQSCDFSDNETPIPSVNYSEGVKCYLLTTCGNDSLVKLWKITVSLDNDITVKLWRTLVGHGGNVTCVRFSPQNGEVLCSVATDRQARIWSSYSSVCLHVLEHNSVLTSCAFSLDNTLLAVGCLDKSLWIWKMPEHLIFQTTIANKIRMQRKNMMDWNINDVTNWMNNINLNDFTTTAVENDVDGKKLLFLEEDEISALLQLDDSMTEHFFEQLNLLKKIEERTRNDSLDAGIPHEYLCPITQEIMREPVICTDGHTYEKQAISEWFLSGRYTSPMTNEPLVNTNMTVNTELRDAIRKFIYSD